MLKVDEMETEMCSSMQIFNDFWRDKDYLPDEIIA